MNRGKLAIILLIVLFASSAVAGGLTGTLKQIKKTGQIKIGYRTSEPPMSFLDKNGNPAGYSIDISKFIVKEVEKKIGKDIKVIYVPVNSENRFKALTDNKIDILCGATTKTLSRMEIVDFTQLTFVTGASLMTLQENKPTGENSLKGKKIGVVRDTTTLDALKKAIKKSAAGAKIVQFDKAEDGIDALLNKRIDAFASDQVVLVGLALKSGTPEKFAIDSQVFSYEPFAFAIRRNDADFRLVADRTIAALCRSGEIVAIYYNWVGRFVGQRLPIYDAMVQLNAIPE
ncbi:MAG: hypothetical protein DRG59_04550 [Deltaproteobacteria bacterium]|nr:MAG: hypothetical protein DRG59_04550 [Deltaproteobacteria bacterium]